MKKFWNSLKWIGTAVAMFVVVLTMLVGVLAFQASMESNVREQAYAEGQVDVINDDVSYMRLMYDATSESDVARARAYAQGADDANDGDIRIEVLTDSTYKYIKSPWGKDKPIPTETFLIKK